jgi:hypothetical protein
MSEINKGQQILQEFMETIAGSVQVMELKMQEMQALVSSFQELVEVQDKTIMDLRRAVRELQQNAGGEGFEPPKK